MNDKEIPKMDLENTEDSVLEAIITGLKNGLNRNETIEKAKQTMVNAGYDPRKVEEASRHLELMNTKTKVEEVKGKKIKLKKNKKQKLPKEKKVKRKKRKDINELNNAIKTTKPSKRKIWIYIVVTVIVLVMAALLGLYWDQIVRLF